MSDVDDTIDREASPADVARVAAVAPPIPGSHISVPQRSRCGCFDHPEWHAAARCGGVLSGR